MRRQLTVAIAAACALGAAGVASVGATAQTPPPPVYGPAVTSPTLQAGSPATVIGTVAVGRALLCVSGTWQYGYRQWGSEWVRDVDPVLTFSWLLDSYPIADATIAAYAPVAGDAGHVVTCKVDATYDPDSRTPGVLTASSIAVGVRVPVPATPPAVKPTKKTVKSPCAKLKGAAKTRCVKRQRCLKLKGARRKACLRKITVRKP